MGISNADTGKCYPVSRCINESSKFDDWEDMKAIADSNNKRMKCDIRIIR
jgi:hypothetical protein